MMAVLSKKNDRRKDSSDQHKVPLTHHDVWNNASTAAECHASQSWTGILLLQTKLPCWFLTIKICCAPQLRLQVKDRFLGWAWRARQCHSRTAQLSRPSLWPEKWGGEETRPPVTNHTWTQPMLFCSVWMLNNPKKNIFSPTCHFLFALQTEIGFSFV